MRPPLATALSSTLNVGMLYRTLRVRGHFAPDAQVRRRIPRLLLASLIMGGVLYLLDPWADPYLIRNLPIRVAALSVLCCGGALVYFLACFATGAFQPADIRLLRRRAPAD